ncbi:MAG: ABC transporter permease [Firmicutes bacterium]|nr:ABC transporter permease [Bacillota bacterium]
MSDVRKIDKSMWEQVSKDSNGLEVISRPSMTYWQDVWRRLKKNYTAIAGMIIIILLVLAAVIGPMVSSVSYSDQNLNFANLPPKLALYELEGDDYLYVHKEYRVYLVKGNGLVEEKLVETKDDVMNRSRMYNVDGKEIILDYSFAIKNKDVKDGKKFELLVDGKEAQVAKTVRNKNYFFGSDTHGRDLLVRVLIGARISLMIALVATVVNFFIGVLYGGVSGYMGGKVDNAMMRFVDIINTIPMMLYIILLMVVLPPGLGTIMLALGLTYWVRMARIVRGQVLSLKEQEFVLAARTLGASTWRIMLRHLIPNAMGPIIISLTMSIPSAIFTEAFLSFVGLGVPAPLASWGTLANDALNGLRSYPYQLLYPSLAICITMLAFNFLGDGLRDALDPRLRK